MQFKVPQNIDMEDRIIGPLTLNQFFYLLFGGILIYYLFQKIAIGAGSLPLFLLLAVPLGLIAFTFAFVKINNRPFASFFLAAMSYMLKPKQRVWQHSQQSPQQAATAPKIAEVPKVRKNIDINKIDKMADFLDEGVKNGR